MAISITCAKIKLIDRELNRWKFKELHNGIQSHRKSLNNLIESLRNIRKDARISAKRNCKSTGSKVIANKSHSTL